jgi:hypothetical protein
MTANPPVPPVVLSREEVSVLKPAHQTSGFEVNIARPKLTDLPGIMRRMGWKVAPILMERWFAGSAYELTQADSETYNDDPMLLPPDRLDESTVTMVWANRFARFQTAKKELLSKWRNDAAQNALRNTLHKVGWPKGNPTLGNDGMTARRLHASCQIQYVLFGSLMSTIDDMYGALGKASAYLAVVGRVHTRLHPNKKRLMDVFIVEKLGVYIRDIYEFNDDQPLGLWTKNKVLGKAEILRGALAATVDFSGEVVRESALETIRVNNADFRKWRDKYGKGGDFYIFSDVEWHPVPDGQNVIVLS